MSPTRHETVKKHIRRKHSGIGDPISINNGLSRKQMGLHTFHHFPFHRGTETSLSSLPLGLDKKNKPHGISDTFEECILKPLRQQVEFLALRDQLFSRVQQNTLQPTAPGLNNNSNNYFFAQYYGLAQRNSDDIFGYRAYKCKQCFFEITEFHFLEKGFEQNRISEHKHTCSAETLAESHLVNDKDLLSYMHCIALPLKLKEMVINEWGKHNSLYLYAIELPNPLKEIIKLIHPMYKDRSIILQYSLENITELSDTNGNHWAARAIKEKTQKTMLTEGEVTDFLKKASNATFGLFKVQSNALVHIYLMVITADIQAELLPTDQN